MAPSLEYLAVEIPFNRGIRPLAESVPSLRNLKVHSLTSPHSCAWHVVQANGDVLLGCKWCQQVLLGPDLACCWTQCACLRLPDVCCRCTNTTMYDELLQCMAHRLQM